MDLRRVSLVVAIVALSAAVWLREGMYTPVAVGLLALALVATVTACISRPRDFARNGIEWSFHFTFLALLYAVGAIVWIVNTSEPVLDVYVFQRDACWAIRYLKNPYTIDFPNIYGPSGSWVYAPQFVHGDRLTFGYPYLPLTLWWDFPGFLLGDYRWMNLIATIAAGTCIAAIGRSVWSCIAAGLLLFNPVGFLVLKFGWTEPLSAMLLAAVVLAISRESRLTPILFGLLLASKQYCAFALLLIPLIAPPGRARWRWLAIAAASALAVTLPMVLINVKAFWQNVVLLQFQQPFRDDSLSFAVLFGPVSTLPAMVSAVVVAVVVNLRLRRSAASFAIACATMYLVFFAFNKQAFANYYFFVIAAMCCALASFSRGPRSAISAETRAEQPPRLNS